LAGALVGAIGLWLRAYAAGYLHKQEFSPSRSYAYTRKSRSIWAVLSSPSVPPSSTFLDFRRDLLVYFALIYSIVHAPRENEPPIPHHTEPPSEVMNAGASAIHPSDAPGEA